jgi:hypothetical protein
MFPRHSNHEYLLAPTCGPKRQQQGKTRVLTNFSSSVLGSDSSSSKPTMRSWIPLLATLGLLLMVVQGVVGQSLVETLPLDFAPLFTHTVGLADAPEYMYIFGSDRILRYSFQNSGASSLFRSATSPAAHHWVTCFLVPCSFSFATLSWTFLSISPLVLQNFTVDPVFFNLTLYSVPSVPAKTARIFAFAAYPTDGSNGAAIYGLDLVNGSLYVLDAQPPLDYPVLD